MNRQRKLFALSVAIATTVLGLASSQAGQATGAQHAPEVLNDHQWTCNEWNHMCSNPDHEGYDCYMDYYPHSFVDSKCTVCGYECEHDWSLDIDKTYDLTQADPGKKIACYSCEYCSHSKVEEVGECTDSEGHDWNFEIIPATCVSKGCTKHICYYCDSEYLSDFEDVNPDNHNWYADEDYHICGYNCYQYNDWQSHNLVDGKCTVCGYWQGHTEHQWDIDSYEHRCTIPGCEDFGDWQSHAFGEDDKCTACGYECEHWWLFDIDKTYELTQADPGKKIACYSCGYCSHSKVEEVGECTDSEGHYWDFENIPATCVSKGYTIHTCDYCDSEYLSDFEDVNPDNHDWYTDEDDHICGNYCYQYNSWQPHDFVDGKCTACGYWPVHTEHQWVMDGYEHRCTIPGCEDFGGWQSHEYDESGVCTVCGYVDRYAHQHNLADGKCTLCGMEFDIRDLTLDSPMSIEVLNADLYGFYDLYYNNKFVYYRLEVAADGFLTHSSHTEFSVYNPGMFVFDECLQDYQDHSIMAPTYLKAGTYYLAFCYWPSFNSEPVMTVEGVRFKMENYFTNSALKDENGNEVQISYDEDEDLYYTNQPVVLTDEFSFIFDNRKLIAPKVTYVRDLSNLTDGSNWGTLCLPFAYSVADAKAAGITMYELSGSTEDALVVSQTEMTEVYESRPMIFKRDASLTELRLSVGGDNNVEMFEPNWIIPMVPDTYYLLGFIRERWSNYDDEYYLSTDGKIYNVGEYCNKMSQELNNQDYMMRIPPYRCLINYFSSGFIIGAPHRIVEATETPAGIEAVGALLEGKAEIYDLEGVRHDDLQPGVNVLKLSNGKVQKVILK